MVSSIHVLGSRELGGADRFFIRLVEALQAAGHPTTAVTRPGSPVARALSPSIEQVHLPLASKWDLPSRWRLTRLIAQRQPDVVQTYMGRATRLTRLPAGSRTALVARLGGFYKIAGYYEHADAWVGNTRAICDYLIRSGMPAGRVFHIGNFVPTPRAVAPEEIAALRAHLRLPPQARVLLALGRVIAKKGFADLLDAFAQAPDAPGRAPVVLVLAGDGPDLPALREQCSRLGLDARVRFAGWQDDPDPFYELAELFVCPSRHEPLGNVILEAWQHALPVLSTRNEGAAELVDGGRNALLAPCGDPAALAQALREMFALDAGALRGLAEAGRETARSEHGADAVVGAYLALYERLITERRSGAR